MSTSSGVGGGGDEQEVGERGADPGLRRRRRRRRRGAEQGEPSSSSAPGSSSAAAAGGGAAMWPEHLVETVAVEVAAAAAARSGGRLAAAPALASFFQVCSTWRAVSQSEAFWRDVTFRLWPRRRRLGATWRDELIRLHRTGRNFRMGRSAHSHLMPSAAPDEHTCCRLALSDRRLAAGFLNGSVQLFDVPGGHHLAFYESHPQHDGLGPFSRAVSGLVFLADPDRLVFASHSGDVHVADAVDPVSHSERRACTGNVIEDGTMVDFTGNERWWVGLFAGVPGRSWHVWDANTEQLVYVGGMLTDPDALLGWRLLTHSGGPVVGRARMAEPGTVVGCTSSRIQVMGTEEDLGTVVNELELDVVHHGASADACEGQLLTLDENGTARVRGVPTLEEVRRFNIVRRAEAHGGALHHAVGCMNWGYAILGVSGRVRVWDACTGEFLYSFRERVGISVVAANDSFVAGWDRTSGLHLWDFGAV